MQLSTQENTLRTEHGSRTLLSVVAAATCKACTHAYLMDTFNCDY